MPDVPDLPAGGGEQRELLVRLQAVIEAKETEIGVLRSGLDVERELRRRLELRVAELEQRLDQDSADPGTPTSKENIGARERRKARRRQWQESERDRRKDRKPGGQPGHPGMGLSRDPDETKSEEPPAECRRCKTPPKCSARARLRVVHQRLPSQMGRSVVLAHATAVGLGSAVRSPVGCWFGEGRGDAVDVAAE